MTATSWSIIVLSWNGRDDTLACLESLRQAQRPGVDVVCVDNGSTDNSVLAIRERFPEVELIEAGVNLGYAGGNNLGIAHALAAGAHWCVLVNNDATVAPDVIDGFAAVAAMHPEAGMLAGKVYEADSPETVAFAGQRVNTLLGTGSSTWSRPSRRAGLLNGAAHRPGRGSADGRVPQRDRGGWPAGRRPVRVRGGC